MAGMGAELEDGASCQFDFAEHVISVTRANGHAWVYQRTTPQGQEILGSVTLDSDTQGAWRVRPVRSDWSDRFAAMYESHEAAARALLQETVR